MERGRPRPRQCSNEDSASQRDFVPKPNVARHELPWSKLGGVFNRTAVVADLFHLNPARKHASRASPKELKTSLQ